MRNLRLRFWLRIMDAAFTLGAWNRGADRRWRLYCYALGRASNIEWEGWSNERPNPQH